MESTDNIKFIFQFNNKNRSASFFILYMGSGALFLATALFCIFTSMNILLICTVAFGIIYFILFHLYKPAYFEFLVTETELQVNYYSAATTLRSYQSVLIPLNQLKGFSVKTKMAGFKKDLILTVESKFGLADYPPISVSILKQSELNQIIFVLTKIQSSNIK